jgi:DNA-binding CsgD family transcriptional regulator
MKGLNFDEDAQARYNAYYWRLDPTLDVSRRAQDGAWADCSELFDSRTTPYREYVNDYALPTGLRWVAGGKARLPDDSCIILGLQRPPDATPFDTDTKAIFERLHPHLKRIYLISGELQSARQKAAFGTAAIDGLRQAAYVVSEKATLLYANLCGEAELRQEHLLILRNGSLQLARGTSCIRLAAAIRAATSAHHSSASAWAETASGDGTQWALRVVPMNGMPGRALVYAVRVANCTVPAKVLQQTFGMTGSEAEVAYQLADGATVKEIAFKRGVSELTVRAQVRAVLAKTGARRLPALSAILRSIPALSWDTSVNGGDMKKQ